MHHASLAQKSLGLKLISIRSLKKRAKVILFLKAGCNAHHVAKSGTWVPVLQNTDFGVVLMVVSQ